MATKRALSNVPHALDAFDALERAIDGRRPALFLDYDGTLTPIVDRPEDARISAAGRAAVEKAAARLPTAVVSGRDRPDVEDLVGISDLIYAGSHGFDIRLPDGRVLEHSLDGLDGLLDAVEQRLHQGMDPFDGTQVERKKFSIAAHYRRAGADGEAAVKDTVQTVVEAYPDKLKAKPGKCVLEIQPKLDWDKGKAVFWLMEQLALDRDDVVPFFFGDDVTDEDAFAALAETERGLGIIAADAAEEPDRETRASFRVDDVPQVYDLLARLAELAP